MRIVKMVNKDEDMKTCNEMHSFFNNTLRQRVPEGMFYFGERKIPVDGLAPREMLLFTYKARLVYYAQAKSRRIDNDGRDAKPYCFVIDMDSLRACDVSVHKVAKKLEQYGYKNVSRSPCWNPIYVDGVPLDDEYVFFKNMIEQLS